MTVAVNYTGTDTVMLNVVGSLTAHAWVDWYWTGRAWGPVIVRCAPPAFC